MHTNEILHAYYLIGMLQTFHYMTLENFTLQNTSMNNTIIWVNSTMASYVNAMINASIYNDTLTRLDCNNEQVVKWNETSGVWYCSDISAPGAGDIDAVNTDNNYITGGQTSGTVNLAFNETVSIITTY